jgi:hypothetical protein
MSLTANCEFLVINDDVREEVRVTVHKNGKPVEFFRFHSGHFLLSKSDERIIEYCKEKLNDPFYEHLLKD